MFDKLMVADRLMINQRTLIELARRLRVTSVVNLFLWVFLTVMGGWFFIEPVLVGVSTLIFALATLYRHIKTSNVLESDDLTIRQIAHSKIALRIICMCFMLFWGVAAAYVFIDMNFSESREMTLAVLAFIGGTASSSFSIDRFIGKWCGGLFFIPLAVGLIYCGITNQHLSAHDFSLIVITLMGSVFLYRQNKTTADAFEESQINRCKAEARARKMTSISNVDSLTQINNRMYFDNYLQGAWDRGRSNHSRVSLFLVDLDHFKVINDKHGHLFGDECLKLVASNLKSQLRQGFDCVARFGGEEFVLLIEDTEAVDVVSIADRLLKSIKDMDVSFEGAPIELTCSIGLASVYPHKVDSFTQILFMADKALYRAKANGRDRVCFVEKTYIKKNV